MPLLSRLEEGADRLLRRWERTEWALTLFSLLLFGAFLGSFIADPDLFARMAVGRLVLEQGNVPLQDPFAFTARLPVWIDHEWLSGVVFYLVNAGGGDQGLFLFKGLMAFASAALLWRAHQEKAAHPAPLLVAVALLQSSAVWMSTVRSQTFTYAFTPFLLLTFARYEKKPRRALLLPLPLMMLFWANLHGGFVTGLGLLGLFALGRSLDQRRLDLPLFGALFASIAATAATPYPPLAYWSYILEAVTMSRPAIDEWHAVEILSPFSIIPLTLSALLLWGLFKGGPRRATDLLLLVASAWYGFRHLRLMPLFMMTMATHGAIPVTRAAGAIPDRWRVLLARSFTFAAALASVVSAALALRFFLAFGGFRLDYSGYPVEALRWLREERQGGNLLVDFNRGSYALWVLAPRFKVSLDGRYEELYPESTVLEVADALSPTSPSRTRSLSRIDPDFVLMERSDVDQYAFDPEWSRIYEDDKFTILERFERD